MSPVPLVQSVIPLLLLYIVGQCKGDCTFPTAWYGKWFQAGVESYVEFNATYMDMKGPCKGSCYISGADGRKFILQDKTEDPSDPTFKCVAVFVKHTNVLQYKEVGRCEGNQDDLEECCTLYSDNPLNTLIRVDKTRQPIPCPFPRPPYSFSYTNGGDSVCDRPLSRVDSCTDPTKLLFRFSACPDIKSSQSADEEMTCLAVWRENSIFFMIAQLTDWKDPSSPSYASLPYVPPSDENQYRCFVFDSNVQGFNMAQSGDATCTALTNPNEGSKTFKLTKDEGAVSKCKFPTWVIEEHEWRSLDGSKSIVYMASNGTLRIRDSSRFPEMETNIYCQSIETTNEHKHQKYKAFALSGCNSGYMCLSLYHRDSHIVQVQYSDHLSSNLEEACSSFNFDTASLPLVTMVTGEELAAKQCPDLGRWGLNGSDVPQYLSVGCDAEASSVVLSGNPHAEYTGEPGYQCRGHWGSINDTGYILASQFNRSDTYCFIYNGSNTALSVKRVLNSCDPTSQSSDNVNYRLSYLGKCVESTSHLHSSGASDLQATIVFLLVITFPFKFHFFVN
ncbi:uncharacterized protein LOC103505445 isoform X2 [Diaphorina citri]|uniref:Uncharacterized protein LOC103505445 isoform X1 n=1 Tax=Diaphorina citri TaxID=121845 RepID=A0A1S4E6U7_DIACI|nr:uncharacterized protein LOC103505445 isoform X3 [Diaphorina citri]XP_026676588.1 uncharacterized protein LOC103505445 isoform X1 [Diaphorina citri]XP_026676589.1 uncharacterized protein LOC103505445 isoform X2 [Diaphorina citri]